MRLPELERENTREPKETFDRVYDLFWGIGPSHIRRLCESSWEGGYGIDPSRVGLLTLDQVYFLLCDKQVLRESGKRRTQNFSPISALSELKETSDGKYAGVSRTGKKIQAEYRGKSKARRLMEEMENRKAEERRKAAEEDLKRRRRMKRQR